MRLVRSIVIASVLVSLSAAPLFAQGATARATAPAPAAPAGKWILDMNTPHGQMKMTFDLKVDGEKITGTYTTDMTGTIPTSGTFKDGKVSLNVDMGQERVLDFHFTFKDKDTLTGNISSEMGDLACTATRLKEKTTPSV